MGGRVWALTVSGRLAPFAGGFESWLVARGYSSSAVGHGLWRFDRLSRWLEREGLGAGELLPERAPPSAASTSSIAWSRPSSLTAAATAPRA